MWIYSLTHEEEDERVTQLYCGDRMQEVRYRYSDDDSVVGSSSSSWTPPIGAFYVSSSTGDDAKDGLSSINAWRTLAKVNSYAFDPGAYVAFKKNDVWRETLTISRNGSAGSPITLGYYGSGALLPTINGADVITGFATDIGTLGAEEVTNGNFDSNINGWSGYGTVAWQSGAIGGRSNVIKLTSSHGSSDSIFAPAMDLAMGIAHTLTFDYYLPSTNTTANGVRAREIGGANVYLGSTLTEVDAWHTATVPYTPGYNLVYFYPLANGVATSTVGDIIYIDNVSIKSDAVPLANVWNVALTTQPNIVLVNNARGTYKTSKTNCATSGDWFWTGNVLSVNYASDPSGIVEGGIRNQCVDGTGNYNSFNYIKFTANQTFSVYMPDSANLDIQHCTFEKIGGRGQNGIGVLLAGDNCNISWNLFDDIQKTGIVHNGSGVANVSITHNQIKNCWNTVEYPTDGGDGISAADSWDISYNYVYRCFKGIQLNGSTDTLCHHNIVVECQVNGIDHIGGTINKPDLIYNNTVIHRPGAHGSGHGIDAQLGGDYVKIKNNLVYVIFTGTKVNLQGMGIELSTYSGIDTDYNLVYKIPTSTADLYLMASSVYNTLADWQTALAGTAYSGKGVHDLSADPLFVDFANGNYNLQANSPAIGAGCDVGLGETNPNIGAL